MKFRKIKCFLTVSEITKFQKLKLKEIKFFIPLFWNGIFKMKICSVYIDWEKKWLLLNEENYIKSKFHSFYFNKHFIWFFKTLLWWSIERILYTSLHIVFLESMKFCNVLLMVMLFTVDWRFYLIWSLSATRIRLHNLGLFFFALSIPSKRKTFRKLFF